MYPSPEHLRPVLEQMIARRQKYADSKSDILQTIPLFETGTMMIHKVCISKQVEETGLTVT